MTTVSIITVCYNAAQTIAETLNSVQRQTYPHIEHIVVDGASTDDTLAIVKANSGRVAKLISEKDKGLYDGMNKGIAAATGDYIYFLNADDAFYTDDVLEQVLSVKVNADVYYGEVMITDASGNELGLRSRITTQKCPECLNWKSLKKGMVVSHQGFIVKRSICETYDLQYRIASDIDWMIRCLKNANNVVNTKLVIARFAAGGTSKQRRKQAWNERFRILQKHYGVLPNAFNHILIIIRKLLNPKAY